MFLCVCKRCGVMRRQGDPRAAKGLYRGAWLYAIGAVHHSDACGGKSC